MIVVTHAKEALNETWECRTTIFFRNKYNNAGGKQALLNGNIDFFGITICLIKSVESFDILP